ncbi:MAG TPA: acyltransferase family protein [Mycobacterium sp.]|nr:MAG: acyltransferase [Mycobacterium sp.]HOB49416.1 acyltransferase family protein [Mycobacterium sp.]HQE15492.1 acyltransferase family protein [Mycobacterium sp.]
MSTLTLPRPSVAAPRIGADRAPDAARGGYRHDLDGLRGVAIALVAVFHVWFGRVSGGVDVFLALSGFFFGSSVLRAVLRPGSSLSPLPNLTKLIRRLLPALIVVLTAAAVLTVLIQPQTRWEAFADQTLASLGYYQNWELAATAADYLRAGETVSPLQHIWSMSVQGQFYVAFLLLAFGLAALLRRWLGSRLRAVYLVVIAALTVASFVYAIIAHQNDQTMAYYNSFARGWELLLGVLVGAMLPMITWPMWLRTLAALVGLVTILACGWLIDGVQQFPGPWALVPVGATMLLIMAGANRGSRPSTRDRLPWPNRMLATRPLVTLGSMAYSLYLWHWPLLIFWLAYTGGAHAGFVDGLVILVISGILAYLTMRFIEEPLRRPGNRKTADGTAERPRTRLIRPATVGGTVVALLGVALTVTSFAWRDHVTQLRESGSELAGLSASGYPGARALVDDAKVPQLPFRPTVMEAEEDLPKSTSDGCISDFDNAGVITCSYGDLTATRTIALAGGSHAEHWITALDMLGKQHNFKVTTYLKMGCPLTTEKMPLVMGDNRPYPSCREWNERVMAKLITDRPDFVFTTSTRPWNIKPGDTMPGTYIGIWQKLSDHDIPILAMRDTPWLVRNGKAFRPADCLAKGGDAVSCGVKRSQVLSARNQTLDFTERFPKMKVLDMSDAVCRADICRAVEGNVLIYHDAHHLSATYMRTMAPELGRQLGAATGWW